MNGRRRFIAAGACLAAAAAYTLPAWRNVPLTVSRPGMREGHWLRDTATLPIADAEIRCDVAIVGSGVAGLTAAWKLALEGHRDFVLITGPEYGGNASGSRFGELAYPRGAHYLPLPSAESVHIRELLSDLGVIESGPYAERPSFDERVLVHAPDERLLMDGTWQEGLLPAARSREGDAQQRRFFALVEDLKTRRGRDGLKAFAVPTALSSTDPAWTVLDGVSFDRWLDAAGFRAPTLRWYLDYCCRDDYGAGSDRISAWAGLHYFASRGGHAANASDGAVLTWPEGLGRLVADMTASISRRLGRADFSHDGFATRIREDATGVAVDCARFEGDTAIPFRLRAQRVVCAVPLFVAAKIVPDLPAYGYVPAQHAPPSAPWLVANFLLDGFPAEAAGAGLAWDNVLYGSDGLGYVVSTHQALGTARPPRTVFTAYRALAAGDPAAARRRLAAADDRTLRTLAAVELERAYGRPLALCTRAIDVTLRGHAMASPTPGFLSNCGLRALREAGGRLMFAHSDLSGLSLFEEASWWGYRAAQRILRG